MAVLNLGGQTLLVGTDMLLDGVHFDSGAHGPGVIGYKAVACCLSDCAAMAARPLACCLSVALPRGYSDEDLKALTQAAVDACEAFECELVGGDTTVWDHPLAVEVALTAAAYPDVRPILRSGAREGDGLYVTGSLGGSRSGKHLTFVPRIGEAHLIATTIGSRLHAMIDISDGLAIDADRIAEASGVMVVLDASQLDRVASAAARGLSRTNGRALIDRVLGDGEDFELLVAADIDASAADQLHLLPVGCVGAGSGVHLQTGGDPPRPLDPVGYQHLR